MSTTTTLAAEQTARFPKPLFVVHRMEPGRLFTADCGALTGSRQFDIDLQTFVQHTGHYTLTAEQPTGLVACADCLGLQAVAA